MPGPTSFDKWFAQRVSFGANRSASLADGTCPYLPARIGPPHPPPDLSPHLQWYAGTVQSTRDTEMTPPACVSEVHLQESPGKVNWPNFFVVGAQKAGTTYLYHTLKRHPEAFLPRQKELRYFQPGHQDSASLDRYRALYADATGYKAIGEITPFYLFDPDVPARIRQVCPDAKIIIVLRDPIERAYSHYLDRRRDSDDRFDHAESFREALRRYNDRSASEWRFSQEYIEHGFYYEQVRRYLETFGRDRVLILLFDDLAKNSNELLMRVARHIGVDPGFFAELDVSQPRHPYAVPRFAATSWLQRQKIAKLRVVRSVGRALRPILYDMKKPPMDEESLRQLQQLFEPDVTRLEELLGRKLPELRKTWLQ